MLFRSKRIPADTYSAQHRGGRGITAMQTREEDIVDMLRTTSTHDFILFFTNTRRVFKLKGYQIPDAGRQARGMAVVNLLQLSPDEKVTGFISIEDFDQDKYLLFATAQGQVKKTSLDQYLNIHKGGLIAINLRKNDSLVGVELADDKHDVILVTQKGKGIRFSETDVRATGRNTSGVRGIKLSGQDQVIAMVVPDRSENLLIVTENGFGKATNIDDFRVQNRGGKGLIAYKITQKTGKAVNAVLLDQMKSTDILLINDAGIIIRINSSEVPVLSRSTQGVTLMRTHDSKVVDLSLIEKDEEDDEKIQANADVDNSDANNAEEENIDEDTNMENTKENTDTIDEDDEETDNS